MSANQRFTTLRRLLLQRSVPYGLLALSCALSAAASWYVSSTAAASAETQARAEFLTDAQETRRDIQTGLNSYAEVVRTGAVLLSANNEINGADFRRFVAGLQLADRYPGMEGIGFTQCVRRPALAAFLRLMDSDGNGIRVWPRAVRAEHCPTVFLEPSTDRNRRGLGFDFASDPILAETMAEARDTGEGTLSRKVRDLPVWNEGWRGNLVLFIPVYQSAARLGSVDDRRRALLGFVFSPFDSERMLDAIVTSVRPSVAFEIFDGAPAPENALGGSHTTGIGRYEATEVVRAGRREWSIAVKSIGNPTPAAPQLAQQTLIGGILLGFMLFLVTRAQVRAWETAARHEQELLVATLALRESEGQARAANRAKDEFLATLSHELRTPLNVVLGWVNMLRHGTVPENRFGHALEIIERNARHQADLIGDLLDVSRIVAGNLRLELHPLSVGPIVSNVVDSLRPGADAKGVTLTGPQRAETFTVLGDADRLRQATWNLVANAIKFTPAGGSVAVDLSQDTQHVRLTVRDTGIGISRDFLPHVFERFRQADSSTTREHSGMGLGLAIARQVVELHGGTIDAHSDGPNRGATFVIALPVAAAASYVRSSVPELTAPVDQQLRGVHVLVVDDDPATLDMLSEALETTGAHVTAADSARDALQHVSLVGADVIVSDIAMPGEDGYWLMQHVRALPGERGRTPAIALTALARNEDRTRAIEAGYQLHLAKPVELDELQAQLAMLVAGAEYHEDRPWT